jgi:hypothetical protein
VNIVKANTKLQEAIAKGEPRDIIEKLEIYLQVRQPQPVEREGKGSAYALLTAWLHRQQCLLSCLCAGSSLFCVFCVYVLD